MLDEFKFIFFAIFFLCGIFLGGCVTNRAWEKDAIIRGFGYYSDFSPPLTSNFKWVNIVNDTQLKSDSRNLYYKREIE